MAAPPEYDSIRHQKKRRFRKLQKQLGLRLRQLRAERGWTLEKAGAQSGLDFRHWQKLEAGQVNVTLVTLDRVAMGLGVSVVELFEAG